MRSALAPVQTHAHFDIPFPREAVWAVLSKTDWLNRSTGMPPITYKIEAQTDGGTRVFAKTRFLGINFTWEEKPFEWREPEFYRVERCFATGPIVRIVVGMEFVEVSGGTRLRILSEVYPANPLGRVLARFVLAPQATSGMGSVVGHVTEFLKGQQHIAFPKLKRSEPNESVLNPALSRLRECLPAGEQDLATSLERLLRESADVEVTHLRPFSIARSWQKDRWDVLRLFLRATRAGVLDLSWEVLCPNCRSTRAPRINDLADLQSEAHCEVCQIRFDAEFDKSVELKFSINPGIKSIDENTFCLAGPGAKPHVIDQRILPPKSTTELLVPPGTGLRLRSPQMVNTLEGEALKGIGRVVFSAKEMVGTPRPESGQPIILENQNPFPVLLQVERTLWNEDILTALCVTNLQEFRDLFANQVISPTERIVVGQQIILFTDLRGSTAIYCDIGDAPAYALVRDHFGILHDAIRRHRGAVVKTIGDAVMAAFSHAGDALEAVREMHATIQSLSAPPDQGPLQLKSSLHLGPCLAVSANDRLDYFGTTVNLAARLVGCCQGGDLALSDDYYKRSETSAFLQTHGFTAESAEMKFRGFPVPIKLWRVRVS